MPELMVFDDGRIIIPKQQVLGRRFGRLVAVAAAPSRRGRRYVLTLCECGTERVVMVGNLLQDKTHSCGCLQRDRTKQINFRHGDARRLEKKASEWVIWCQMRQRCTNPKNPNWPNYGGRGIRMCDHWLRSYQAFLDDVGRRPSPCHSIDRINVNGDYEPGNVRWADPVTQRQNQRCMCPCHLPATAEVRSCQS